MATEITGPLSPELTAALGRLNARLEELKAASELQITDNASLVKAAEVRVEFDSYLKSVRAFYDVDLGLAGLEERVKRLKLGRTQLEAPVEGWKKLLVDRMRAYQAEEKRKADEEAKRKQQELEREKNRKAEEDRRALERQAEETKRKTVAEITHLQETGAIGAREAAKRLKAAGAEEEAAKQSAAAAAEEAKAAPAPTIRVVPNLPSAPGIRNQTYYKAETTDDGAAIIAFLKDPMTPAGRKEFLSQFVMVNPSEISRYAREVKNNEKVMHDLPGVKAWSEG